MKKISIILFSLLVLGLMGATGYYLYTKTEKKVQKVLLEAPQYRSIVKKTVANGAIEPRKEVEIKPKASGIISKLYVESGQIVKAGDIIAQIKIIPNMVTLNNAEVRVDRAKIALKDAQTAYNRYRDLLEEKVISPVEFQPRELNYLNAESELKAANDNLMLIKSGATASSKSSSNTLVRSTISGMVLEVPVREGNSVIESNNFNDGTSIATIADMKQMLFRGNVDESEVGKLKEGMRLNLTIGAIEKEHFEALLEHIAPKGKEVNGAIQFEIKASVKLSDSQFIRAGYSANADIVLNKKDSVISISESLINFQPEGKTTVDVKTSNGDFEEKEITLGISDDIFVEILKGVSKGDSIRKPQPILSE